MAAKFRVYDAGGSVVIDENMLMCRYLTVASIAYNDFTEKTITHAGFMQGTPFYHVVNHNRHGLSIGGGVMGTASYIQCSFSGATATFKQVALVGGYSYSGRENLIIHFGVFG